MNKIEILILVIILINFEISERIRLIIFLVMVIIIEYLVGEFWFEIIYFLYIVYIC